MMKPNDHSAYHEWLDLDLEGELGGAERQQLERHLAACEVCRDDRAALAALRSLLAGSRIAARPGFRDEVLAALPPAPWEARHPRAWLRALALLALLGGGAVALVGTGSGLGPAVPFLGAVVAVFDLFRSSLLAGAGLLTASWRGVGLALGQLLQGSTVNLLIFGVLVVGLNTLLVRMLLRPPRAAAGHAGRAVRSTGPPPAEEPRERP